MAHAVSSPRELLEFKKILLKGNIVPECLGPEGGKRAHFPHCWLRSASPVPGAAGKAAQVAGEPPLPRPPLPAPAELTRTETGQTPGAQTRVPGPEPSRHCRQERSSLPHGRVSGFSGPRWHPPGSRVPRRVGRHTRTASDRALLAATSSERDTCA